jgi:SAM-dependent methyltransferase
VLLNRLEYALMNNPVRAGLQRHVEARRLLRMGGPMHGGRALEIGCGRGVGTELILDMFGAERVDAFDLDPRMVALARQRPGAWWATSVTLMVRGEGRTADLAGRVREAVWTVDPALPLYDILGMSAVLEAPLSDQRFGAIVLAGFAGFGLLLAVLGTYGVVAFSVSRRLPEFAVRLALGARPSALVRGVVGEGLQLIAAGLLIGIGGSLALSRVFEGRVTEISTRDPLTLGVVALVLLGAGALATWVPARRAARVDLVSSMRAE